VLVFNVHMRQKLTFPCDMTVIYESLIKETDQTWYAYPLWIAAAIEIDLGVVSSIKHYLTRLH
jgi:hypothetical protein